VVTALRGRPLSEIAARPTGTPDEIRLLARAVGAAVAELHAAGISFPSLFAKHVWIEASPAGPRIAFLDLADAHLERRCGLRERARDLGALAATLPRWPVTLALRRRALDAYLEAAAIGWDRDRAWKEVSRAAARLGRKRRFRRFLATAAVPPVIEQHPDPDTRVAEAERDFLARCGGLAQLEPEGPRGWEISGTRSTLRGDSATVARSWAMAALLQTFAIPAPRPVALRHGAGQSTLLLRQPAGVRRQLSALGVEELPPDVERQLLRLLRRLLRAGLLPASGFAEELILAGAATLGLCGVDALSQPPRVTRIALSRALEGLAAELEALPLPPGVAARVSRQIRREAPALVWLVARRGDRFRRARRGR
jgi:hypothetical protein